MPYLICAVSVISQGKTAPPPDWLKTKSFVLKVDGTICYLWKKTSSKNLNTFAVASSDDLIFETKKEQKDKMIDVITFYF